MSNHLTDIWSETFRFARADRRFSFIPGDRFRLVAGHACPGLVAVIEEVEPYFRDRPAPCWAWRRKRGGRPFAVEVTAFDGRTMIGYRLDRPRREQ